MPTELATSLPDLAKRINEAHDKCIAVFGDSLAHAIEAGEALTEAKGILKHGEWLPWLADNFHGTQQTASVYMRCYENRARLANYGTSRSLSIDTAVKLLAEPRPIKPPPIPEARTRGTRELVDTETGEVVEAKESPARPGKLQIVSKEEYEKGGDVPQVRGVGVRLAHEAINALMKIPAKDALRDEGFDTVIRWIDDNR